MLDGLLKSKFYSKCKSLMKMTKARLDMLKKKKSSVAKFLKNDMAELIRNGLDYNAYCRAEGLLVEQEMLACFNFIEQFCECISSNLSAICKQRECPEECREAVQSLIYAAARIPEFPELRDLRTLFVERYGTHLESFINKQFVETLRPKTTTKEMKLQLMHDIAEEFNIQWNSKSLEQELFKQPQENNRFPKNNDDISPKVNCKGNDGGDDFTKRTKHETGNKVNDTVEDTLLRKEKSKLAFRGRKNSFNERYNLPCSSEDKVISHRRRGSSDLDSLPTGNVHAEADLISEAKPKPKSVRRRPLKPPPGHETVGIVERPLKRPPGHEKFVRPESGAVAKADSTAVKEDEVKRGSMKTQGDDIDQKEEEEKIIDGLLMHYSKDSMKPNLKPPPKLRSTKSDLHFPPGREAYQAEEASPKKAAKGHNRLVSMQPENGHVHPNLPDYEDLAARFAALKRR